MQLLTLMVENGILLSWNDHEGIVETGHLLPNSNKWNLKKMTGLPSSLDSMSICCWEIHLHPRWVPGWKTTQLVSFLECLVKMVA